MREAQRTAADSEPMLVDFRTMRRGDLPVVVRNETRAYAYPWSPGIFADCLAAGHECWVVLEGREIMGHGVLSIGAGEAHLLNVCIARDQQGRGMGRQLLHWMLARARARAATVVFLEVRPSNRVACELYDSIGFCEVGVRPGYYPDALGSEDARVMAMELL